MCPAHIVRSPFLGAVLRIETFKRAFVLRSVSGIAVKKTANEKRIGMYRGHYFILPQRLGSGTAGFQHHSADFVAGSYKNSVSDCYRRGPAAAGNLVFPQHVYIPAPFDRKAGGTRQLVAVRPTKLVPVFLKNRTVLLCEKGVCCK